MTQGSCLSSTTRLSRCMLTHDAVTWPGRSIRRCAQQRSPSGQRAPAWAKRACPPSWYPARSLAACTATWQQQATRCPSQPPRRLRTPPQCPHWTSTSRSANLPDSLPVVVSAVLAVPCCLAFLWGMWDQGLSVVESLQASRVGGSGIRVWMAAVTLAPGISTASACRAVALLCLGFKLGIPASTLKQDTLGLMLQAAGMLVGLSRQNGSTPMSCYFSLCSGNFPAPRAVVIFNFEISSLCPSMYDSPVSSATTRKSCRQALQGAGSNLLGISQVHMQAKATLRLTPTYCSSCIHIVVVVYHAFTK